MSTRDITSVKARGISPRCHAAELANEHSPPHAAAMFVVTEADARCDPRRLPAAGRVRGRHRAAQPLPRHHRQRAGTGVRAHHRWLEATAAAAGEGAAVTPRVRWLKIKNPDYSQAAAGANCST